MYSETLRTQVQGWLGTAQASINAGDDVTAISTLRRITAAMPVLPEPHYQLAAALARAGNLTNAEAEYMLAIGAAGAVGRHYTEAFLGLADVMIRDGRPDQAVPHLHGEFRRDPARDDVGATLARVLMHLCRFEEALEVQQQLLPSQPDMVAPIAQALLHSGRATKALELCGRVLKRRPEDAAMHTLAGLAHLALGQWAPGFAGYRWRWRTGTLPPLPGLAGRVPWDGRVIQGGSILVSNEQGRGDFIQFARWLPRLALRGIDVHVLADAALLPLLAAIPGVASVAADAAALPPCDAVIAVSDLPHALEEMPDLPELAPPYLAPDPARVAMFRQRLAGLPGLRVGLCHAGNPAHPLDRVRSMPVEALAGWRGLPGVSFVSLQPGAEWGDLPVFEAGPLEDFAATAALIGALDAVVSVDTAVAHLAGATGTPLHVLLPHHADWRWGEAGATTVWYPQTRLHRQPVPGGWAALLAEVGAELTAAAMASHP